MSKNILISLPFTKYIFARYKTPHWQVVFCISYRRPQLTVFWLLVSQLRSHLSLIFTPLMLFFLQLLLRFFSILLVFCGFTGLCLGVDLFLTYQNCWDSWTLVSFHWFWYISVTISSPFCSSGIPIPHSIPLPLTPCHVFSIFWPLSYILHNFICSVLFQFDNFFMISDVGNYIIFWVAVFNFQIYLVFSNLQCHFLKGFLSLSSS